MVWTNWTWIEVAHKYSDVINLLLMLNDIYFPLIFLLKLISFTNLRTVYNGLFTRLHPLVRENYIFLQSFAFCTLVVWP